MGNEGSCVRMAGANSTGSGCGTTAGAAWCLAAIGIASPSSSGMLMSISSSFAYSSVGIMEAAAVLAAASPVAVALFPKQKTFHASTSRKPLGMCGATLRSTSLYFSSICDDVNYLLVDDPRLLVHRSYRDTSVCMAARASSKRSKHSAATASSIRSTGSLRNSSNLSTYYRYRGYSDGMLIVDLSATLVCSCLCLASMRTRSKYSSGVTGGYLTQSRSKIALYSI
jgi:hypothetical protein